MANLHKLRHVVSDAPRVMVVDGSKMVRKLIRDVLADSLPNATIHAVASVRDAQAVLDAGDVDLVTTSLALPDGDGLDVAGAVRAAAGQIYVPVIVVSGEAQARLEARTLGQDVTDWFDKALGLRALAAFIHGYVHPQPMVGARVLYVEDSRVVALATKRMLETHAFDVTHIASVEDAIAWLDANRDGDGSPACDLVLTDLYLTGELNGHDLLVHIRETLGHGKRDLPVLVLTGDDNLDNQRGLIQRGANDLVLKPVEERLLVTKAMFQLRLVAPRRAAAARSA